MELNELMEKMTEEEIIEFLTNSANDYLNIVLRTEEYSLIRDKLNNKEKLTDEEWTFILEKIYLVITKATFEENKTDLNDVLSLLFSKIFMKISVEDSAVYNSSYKMKELITIGRKEAKLNSILLTGFYRVLRTKDEEDLNILLEQQDAAYAFRYYRDEFLDDLEKADDDVISTNMYVSINSIERSYEKSKQLKLNYKK